MQLIFTKYPSRILLMGCSNSSELLLSSPQDCQNVYHLFGLWCASRLGHTNSSLLILGRWCVNWKALHLYVVQVHYSCLFTIMEQKYLLTASVFYSWLLIASSPSTNCPASSLMTHLIHFRNATVMEGKMFPLAPESSSWRNAIKLCAVSQKKKTKSTSNKPNEDMPALMLLTLCVNTSDHLCSLAVLFFAEYIFLQRFSHRSDIMKAFLGYTVPLY